MNPRVTKTSSWRRLFNWAFLALLLIGAAWLSVILFWQTTQRVVTLQDVVIYLVALPIVLLGVVFAARLLKRRISRPAASLDASNWESGSPTQISGKDTGSDATRSQITTVLGAWAITAEGEVHAFVDALKERRRRPRPDPALPDGYGFPLMTARIASLALDNPMEAPLRPSAPLNANVPHELQEPSIATIRTTALLAEIIDQVADVWPFDIDAMRTSVETMSAATLRGSEPQSPTNQQPLKIEIKLLVPADVRQQEQEELRRQARCGLQSKLPDLACVELDILPSHADTTALMLLHEFHDNAARLPTPQALLLLACESTLCPSVAEKWEADGRLFTTSTPHGLMMGEAAFGLLCANDAALPLVLSSPVCGIGPISHVRRASSADAPGRPDFSELTQVARKALENANMHPEDIGAIACDADHRTNRTLECIGAMLDLTPRLDAVEDRLATNEILGHLGAASALGSLVAAAIHAHTEDMPVLLLSLTHALERAAAVLLPPSQHMKYS